MWATTFAVDAVRIEDVLCKSALSPALAVQLPPRKTFEMSDTWRAVTLRSFHCVPEPWLLAEPQIQRNSDTYEEA